MGGPLPRRPAADQTQRRRLVDNGRVVVALNQRNVLLAPVLAAVILALGPHGASGQGVSVGQSRLVERFDFETTAGGEKLGRAYDLPPHWYVIGRDPGAVPASFQNQPLHQGLVGREGYPDHTTVGYDDTHTTSGDFSLHLGLDGGSAGAFLEVGSLAAVPRSDYLVTARVRTAELERARASLVAYFVDEAGRRVAASTRQAGPLASDGEWTTISAKLPGRAEEAAWIGLELKLAQPEADPEHPLGTQQVVLKDISGHAWFDDISIWQLPHIQTATQSPVNILRGGDRPRVSFTVRDMTGQTLTAETTIYDHNRRVVAETSRSVGAGNAHEWDWQPELPGYGWYLTELKVRQETAASEGPGSVIAQSLGAFLWLPEVEPLPPTAADQFGLVAEDLAGDQLSLLPKMFRRSGIKGAVLRGWRREDQARDLEARQQQLRERLKSAALEGDRLTMALSPVPEALAEAAEVDGEHTLGVLGSDPENWQPFVRPALHWHGQEVKRWQLGSAGDERAFFQPDLSEILKRVQERFGNMVPGPRLVLPWSLHQPPRSGLPDSLIYAVDVPPGVVPRHLGDYLGNWTDQEQDYRLDLREPPADELGHEDRLADLVRRMLYAWEADRPAMTLPSPWTEGNERGASLLPDPLLGAFTTTARRLSGRRVIGHLPLRDGLQALVFDGEAGGMIAAWNESASEQAATLNLHLGPNPVAIDIWGNRRELPAKNGKHRLELRRTPVFVTGIDPQLAMFRAGFELEEPFIPSLQRPHQRDLRLTNPWEHTITGDLRITGPEGWTIQPARHNFSIPAGETERLPLRMSFPIAEVAGEKPLTAEVTFTANREYQITTKAPMELGWEDVEFDATLALDESGAAQVNCVLTNRGDEPLTVYAFANLPSHPRKERLVANLEAGESVIRRFRFEDAADAVAAHPVRAGVRETNGPAMLNKRVELEGQ